jgi:uncharacterized protein (DUF362 family)
MGMCQRSTRRAWLQKTAAVAAGAITAGLPRLRASAPTSTVAVGRSKTYDPAELVPVMRTMFDQIGGLGRLVKGKTVAIKINLTGSPTYRVGHYPLEDTHYTHPHVIAAAVHLMDAAGARRVRLLESPWSTADPVEEYILRANWEPQHILSAGARVEFENTNWLGNAKKYSRFTVPHGGYIFPAFDLNHSYADCDVFVSIAKMKEHATAGITLSMKNCFGITPCTIYGTGAGADEPTLIPKGGRGMIHSGYRGPSKSAPQENDPNSSREDTYRVPRTVVDLISTRKIDLAIVEGISTMTGGEGPWIREELTVVRPGVIVAGLNPIATDAVSMSLMGFDPMAERGTPPFERCDSTLALAEAAGVGTRDLKRIEVLGTPIADAWFDFASIRRRRRTQPLGPQIMRG